MLDAHTAVISEYTEPSGFDVTEDEPEYSFSDWEPTLLVDTGSLMSLVTGKKRPAKVPVFEQPIISIDTEYTQSEDGKSNHILLYWSSQTGHF